MAENSTATIRKSEDVFGLPLVSVADGRNLGQVRDAVLDSVARKVVGFLIEDAEWQKGLKVMPLSAVVQYGVDAITVRTAKGIPADEASKMKEFAGVVTVTGASVYDVSGQAIGRFLSFNFDPASGEIVRCDLEVFSKKGRQSISAESVVTFGAGAVLVKEGLFLAPVAKTTKQKISPKAEAAPPVSKAGKKVSVSDKTHPAKALKKLKRRTTAKEPVREVVKEKPKAKEEKKTEEKVKAELSVKKIFEEGLKAKPEEIIEAPRAKEEIKPREEARPVKKPAGEVTVGEFLIGQKAANRVTDERGAVIIEAGEVVTEEVVKKAREAGVFLQLSFSVEREIL